MSRAFFIIIFRQRLGKSEIGVLYRCMTTVNDIELLFRKNFKAMLTLANRLVHDEETARDIVHDIFASLLSDSPESVTTAYLLNGVRFACLNHIRDLSVRQRIYNLYSYETDDMESDSLPDDEAAARLNAVIERNLTEQCQRVVRLRFTGRLTYREIAEELGISEVAVYKHLRHALNVLRKNIKDYER